MRPLLSGGGNSVPGTHERFMVLAGTLVGEQPGETAQAAWKCREVPRKIEAKVDIGYRDTLL